MQALLCLAVLGALSQTYAGQVCFTLKGAATSAGRAGFGVGQDIVVTDVAAGDTAGDVMADWKAEWDGLPGNASGPITEAPPGTFHWCVTRYRGAKPTENMARMIGQAGIGSVPGLSGLRVRFVPNPEVPAGGVKIKVTTVIEIPRGGTIRIEIELEIRGTVQNLRIELPTQPNMSPQLLNDWIMNALIQQGFIVQPGSEEFPGCGHLPAFEILGHHSGGALVGAAIDTSDPGLTSFGVSLESLTPPCTGDLDGDGVVGLNDLTLMLSSFGSCLGDSNYNSAADLNGDGCVDLGDLTSFLSEFGSTCA